jgi:hypothetical protein
VKCKKCSKLEQLLLGVGADEWVAGSSTCFRCSPHWSDSSSPSASSGPRYARDASGRWVPVARIPGKARLRQEVDEVSTREFEHPVEPIEWT